MVQIVGKYQHVSNSPEYESFVKTAMGCPSDVAKAIIESRPAVTITENGGQWTILMSDAGEDSISTFKMGETFDESMPHGVNLKSVAKKEGNKVFIKSTLNNNQLVTTRVYEFTDAGIYVQILDDKSVVQGSRTYKRI